MRAVRKARGDRGNDQEKGGRLVQKGVFSVCGLDTQAGRQVEGQGDIRLSEVYRARGPILPEFYTEVEFQIQLANDLTVIRLQTR